MISAKIKLFLKYQGIFSILYGDITKTSLSLGNNMKTFFIINL